METPSNHPEKKTYFAPVFVCAQMGVSAESPATILTPPITQEN